MIKLAPATLALLTATAASAEDNRQLDAHEHGVGTLNIAFDGTKIAMELEAPGADIVGFEYAATSAEDRAKVDAAVATLARPLDLFVLPAAAGCSVVQASASLESEEDHAEHKEEGHDHEEHAEHKEEGHDHEEHAEHKEEGHDHEEHAEHDHDDHKDEDHAAHKDDAHDDHDHEAHADESSHTEFHAEYLLDCADPAAANLITMAYFDAFPNALELEVQVISDKGANAFEVVRSAPTLDLRDMF